MDPLTVAAASGLRSRLEALSLLANNLANAGTSGYKTDHEFYGLYSSPDAEAGDIGVLPSVPVIERLWTDFSEGMMETTNNPLDVAISGRGFFTVKGPSGNLYTRNGSLRVGAKSELINSEGFAILGTDNKPIKVTGTSPIEIETNGVVKQDNQPLGQISVVDFKSTGALQKMSGSCFQNKDPKNPATATTGHIEILQGKLEGSNVAVPEAAMRLVGVMRQFEMLQKAVAMGVDMNRKAIEEVAKV